MQTQKKRQLLGLCPRCAISWDGPTHYCTDCTEWQRLRRNKRLKEKQEEGKCTRCLKQDKLPDKTYCQACLDASHIVSQKYRDRKKSKVFAGYGGACVCCGNTNKRLLQLDHVNNDGAQHRKEVDIMLNWAYKNDCPDSLQLLCANCHHIKTHHGACTIEDHQLNHLV